MTHYTGKLLDGMVFDATREWRAGELPGEPDYRLTEVLQLMKEGAL